MYQFECHPMFSFCYSGFGLASVTLELMVPASLTFVTVAIVSLRPKLTCCQLIAFHGWN